MNLLVFGLWFANMATDTVGHTAFKAAASEGQDLSGIENWKYMASRPWIWIGIIAYVGEFFIWLAFLSQVDLSTGIMLGSFNIVVIMLVGRVLFKELFISWRIVGILLITCGVIVVGFGE